MLHNTTKQDRVILAAARLAGRVKAVEQAAATLLDAARQTKGELNDVHLTTDTLQRTQAAFNALGGILSHAKAATGAAAELINIQRTLGQATARKEAPSDHI